MEHERIILIYEYLSRNTDEERDVSIRDIQNYLESTTNLSRVSVLTIRRDLERLMTMGNDIRTRQGAHNTTYYRLVGKGFTFNEIRFLVDSISINKFLSARQKQTLIKKFEGMCSASEVRQLISRISLNGRGAPSLDLLENLEKVHGVISESRKIDFDYGKFDAQRRMNYYSKKRSMIPAKVIFFNDRFYLKCLDTETEQVRTYRIDRMKNIRSGEKTSRRPQLPKYDGVVLDMFEPESFELVRLRVRQVLLNDMLEQFGEYASVRNDTEDPAYVIVSARIGINDSFYRWVMRYGRDIEVLAPERIRRTLAETLRDVLSLYGDTAPGKDDDHAD